MMTLFENESSGNLDSNVTKAIDEKYKYYCLFAIFDL